MVFVWLRLYGLLKVGRGSQSLQEMCDNWLWCKYARTTDNILYYLAGSCHHNLFYFSFCRILKHGIIFQQLTLDWIKSKCRKGNNRTRKENCLLTIWKNTEPCMLLFPFPGKKPSMLCRKLWNANMKVGEFGKITFWWVFLLRLLILTRNLLASIEFSNWTKIFVLPRWCKFTYSKHK